MKRALFASLATFLISASFVYAYTSPGKPTGLVNDFAKVLSPSQKADLENQIGNFARPAGVQMAVAIVGSLGGDTIENFAEKLFAEWGIGQKISDNGILILVAPAERQVRIEVGYGLEPTVTDAASSVIIRNIMLPAFKTGDYYGGISGGVNALAKLIDIGPEVTPQKQAADYLPVIIFVIFLILVSNRRGRRILSFIFWSGIFRGGGRGGGNGGGFGGFGGGRSGGGGASGSW
jgi:uncharacterized protein